MIFATVSGNIGTGAETRQAGKDTVTTFSVASSKRSKDGGETTTWVRANIWGVRGEKLAQYLNKGTPVTIVGGLELRTYEKDGQTKSALEMRVDDIKLQGKKSDNTSPPRSSQIRKPSDGNSPDSEYGDEIPF